MLFMNYMMVNYDSYLSNILRVIMSHFKSIKDEEI